MGTEIELEIAGLTLDWSKNSRGIDHGALFQECDRKSFHSEQLYHEHYERSECDSSIMDMGFIRPLKYVVPRLELLGFTIKRMEEEYTRCSNIWREEKSAISDHEGESVDLMSFDEFRAFVDAYPLMELNNTFETAYDILNENSFINNIGGEEVARLIPNYSPHDMQPYSHRSCFGGLIEFLHPYSILRLLSENDRNSELNVTWQYGPLVENGWEEEASFIPCARRTQTFLVVTEGSSDTHILKHAFSILRPDIKDFFRFMDVSERHPFSGTGNLLKFAEGLAKIDVQNQVVFLFDNDAEGYSTYQKVMALNLPQNMSSMILPTLEQFRAFETSGPNGNPPKK
ncbi:MAG: hypothetical protein KZQ65_02445 [Candidatus Thiodiazotropha sp. (ex Gloverina cf. vestifex)]|nr:hypothetical protein [Candidatus Thiodiazotropha sp. (ex Gloverina cf. vestifex)]